MRYRTCRAWQAVALALVCLVGVGGVASAQTLAEAARKEAARRKAIKKPARVFTNGSLKTVPGEVIPTPPAPRTESETASAETGTAGASAAAASPETTPAPDPRRTPEYWQQRMTSAVQERDNNALMLDALQSRINGLWADFTARDNPLERNAIAVERQKALDELERRKRLQVTLEKAVADIEEDARRARIPPGWLR